MVFQLAVTVGLSPQSISSKRKLVKDDVKNGRTEGLSDLNVFHR